MNILIVEGDASSEQVLKDSFTPIFGSSVSTNIVFSIEEGNERLKENVTDLVLLDLAFCKSKNFRALKKYRDLCSEVTLMIPEGKGLKKELSRIGINSIQKPFLKEELQGLLNEVQLKIITQCYPNFVSYESKLKNKRIGIKQNDGIRFICIADIERCRSDNNYTEIYLNTKEKLVSSKTLKEFTKLLEEYNFFRVHQSHLVNLFKVKKIRSKDGLYVEMESGKILEVSRRKKEGLLKKMEMC